MAHVSVRMPSPDRTAPSLFASTNVPETVYVSTVLVSVTMDIMEVRVLCSTVPTTVAAMATVTQLHMNVSAIMIGAEAIVHKHYVRSTVAVTVTVFPAYVFATSDSTVPSAPPTTAQPIARLMVSASKASATANTVLRVRIVPKRSVPPCVTVTGNVLGSLRSSIGIANVIRLTLDSLVKQLHVRSTVLDTVSV
eukprot:GILJ01001079.1.p5 GENE.GILJ01001079.1~~GILJ01001079.1.p5  ORF type:complete len:194 (+),score=28.46 GILJ01001079.1:4330-4911(+)